MPDKNNISQKGSEIEVSNLGLSNKDITHGQRLMRPDGTFNSRRVGIPYWESFNFYHYLVGIGWSKFLFYTFTGYVIMNLVFGSIYYLLNVKQHLLGTLGSGEIEKFLEAFFFSAQTLTTLGYGRISPVGFWSSAIAAFESLIGLLTLAIATSLFYRRFSRPIAKILYSKNALIAPFKDVTAFQFRMANMSTSELIDVEVRVMFSILIDSNSGSPVRKYFNLKLEYNKVNFFSLVWTVNHIIDKESPMFGITIEDLEKGQGEFLILVQGFDDTFSQTVHSRYSYRYEEIIINASFVNLYGFDDEGRTTVSLDKISEWENTP